MPTSEDLQRRLSSLETAESALALWRGVQASRQPLSTRGARIRGGRWNPPGVPALYASFEPLTVRAELARAAERRRQVEDALYPIVLVQIEIEPHVIDLTSPDRLEAVGLTVPFSILTPIAETQGIGAAAARRGVGALIVPSVVTRGDNAVLFPDNLAGPIKITSRRRVLSPERWP